jgi:hypothetical protein
VKAVVVVTVLITVAVQQADVENNEIPKEITVSLVFFELDKTVYFSSFT